MISKERRVAVIGLGESASAFTGGCFSIGVNDVQGTDAVVCVDRINAFDETRRQKIISGTAPVFFSQLSEWNFKKGFRKLDLMNVNAIRTINDHATPCSNNSTFVACAVAFQYYRASEIILYGADFNTHKVLADDKKFATTLKDFQLLQKMLRKNNSQIIVGSKISRLYGKL